jgi:hypothetical protein
VVVLANRTDDDYLGAICGNRNRLVSTLATWQKLGLAAVNGFAGRWQIGNFYGEIHVD